MIFADLILCLVVIEDLESNEKDSDGNPRANMNKVDKVKFKLKPSDSFHALLDNWDWIGVYPEDAIKLKDYCSYKYISGSDMKKSRVKFEAKDFKESPSGRYRLIYHSSKMKSAIGTSNLFSIVQ